MGKVVHLDDAAHEKAKAYCKANNIKMSDFVSQLINDGIKKVHRLYPKPVEKKPLPKTDKVKPTSLPAEQPPFWESKGSGS